MSTASQTRRAVILAGAATAGAALTTAGTGLITPAHAQGLAPTPTMRGGANNYRPGAALTQRIGGGGFLMTGTVRRAGDGAPLEGIRIQIWAHTTEGHERDWRSHGATLTDAQGRFQMDMPQIVPAFGQPHGHLAYDAEFDDNGFETVFLRPVMPSARDKTLSAHFVLQPA
ncbi:MAG: twin-arginine translocation pathway signal [Pikeienuella sp.]